MCNCFTKYLYVIDFHIHFYFLSIIVQNSKMSSKGPTVAGSDGSDFSHRQKVADHYKIRYFLHIIKYYT